MSVPTGQRWRLHKLPKRELQLKLTFTFVGVCALAMLLQAVLFTALLFGVAISLPEDGTLLLEASNGLVLKVVVVSCLVFLPLTFVVGILQTFRIAGPIYRFETYLRSVARGEAKDPCRIRKGDELQELCDLINRAIEAARKPPGYVASGPATFKEKTAPAENAANAAPETALSAALASSGDGTAAKTDTPAIEGAPPAIEKAHEPTPPIPVAAARDVSPSCP